MPSAARAASCGGASFFPFLGTTVALWLAIPATALAGADPDGAPPEEPTAEESRRRGAGPAAFVRDTTLTLRLRTYYADVRTVRDVHREAWAVGGWVAHRSGWLADVFRVGATLHGSAPVYAPPDRDGTLLLAPGQEGYWVLGEAFAALRRGEGAVLKVFRQGVEQPYVNGQDNRMTPNTFEGVTLGGTLGGLEYFAGYLTRIKTRNADRFVPMSVAAGARGSDRGVALLGATVAAPGLEVSVADQYGVDTFNTAFAQVEVVRPLPRDLGLRIGVQLTDQRAVGDALAARTRVSRWSTQNGSARAALTAGRLTLKVGGSVTATGNDLQSPWGFYPGYLRLNQELFDHAGQRAWLVGAAWDLSGPLLAGLGASADVAWGVGSIDPVRRARLPDEEEYDLVVTYRPPKIARLVLRLRAVLYGQEGAERLGFGLRLIVNWELPLLGPGPSALPR